MGCNNIACARLFRASTLPLGLPDMLKVCHRDEAASIWYQRIAGFIPVRIVFSADHMEEVAFCETKFLGIVWIGGIVVESFNDLFKKVSFVLAVTQGRVG